jgi:hypothetical protein
MEGYQGRIKISQPEPQQNANKEEKTVLILEVNPHR